MNKTLFYKIGNKYSIYNAVLIGMILTNIISAISNYLAYGYIWLIWAYLLFSVIYLSLYIVGKITYKYDLIILITFSILNIIEFPFVFYFYGTNGLVYLLLGIILGSIFIKGKKVWGLVALTLIVDVAIMLIANFHSQDTIKALVETTDQIEARYKNIPADVSYIISAGIMILIAYLLLRNYDKITAINQSLTLKIEDMSKRDSLTNTFNKKFITGYVEALIKDKRSFTAAVYKISQFNHLEAKYGPQYNDVVVVSLAEVILNECVDKCIVGRVSKSSFVLVFTDNNDVIQTLSNINLKLDGGAVSNVVISRAVENSVSEDTVKSFFQRISSKVKGFGDANEANDIL